MPYERIGYKLPLAVATALGVMEARVAVTEAPASLVTRTVIGATNSAPLDWRE